MIPVLFDGDETTFTTYGKGKLADAISCVIHETLSGEYDLEMEYPVTGRLFSEIAIGKTILASNGAYRRTASFQSNTPKIAQYFDIYKIGEEIDGIVKIYARHVIFRIGRSVIFAPSQDTSTYFKQWAQWIFENANPQISNFNLFTVGGYWPGGQAAYVVDDAFYVNIPTVDLPIAASPAIYLFGSGMLRDKCGVGVICSQFDIFIYSRRGGDYGASVRFGANMTNFNRDIDSTGKYNAVVPFWEKDGVIVTGGLVQPSTPITPVSAVPLDLSNEFDEEPTAAQLETKAGDFLAENEPWNLIDTVEVDMATYNADTYQIIELGDDVRVYFDAFGINIKMRVIEYWYDVLGEEYQRLVIGTPQTEYVTVSGDIESSASGGSSVSPSGGGTFETLWTNSDTTSSFSAQDVPLSGSIEDFDFILVGYVFSTSNQNYSSMMVPASTLWPGGRSCDLRVNAGSYNRTGARTFYASSATSVHFNTAAYNADSTNDGYVIPEHIIGVKL